MQQYNKPVSIFYEHVHVLSSLLRLKVQWYAPLPSPPLQHAAAVNSICRPQSVPMIALGECEGEVRIDTQSFSRPERLEMSWNWAKFSGEIGKMTKDLRGAWAVIISMITLRYLPVVKNSDNSSEKCAIDLFPQAQMQSIYE